jgi:hypothetical protein
MVHAFPLALCSARKLTHLLFNTDQNAVISSNLVQTAPLLRLRPVSVVVTTVQAEPDPSYPPGDPVPCVLQVIVRINNPLPSAMKVWR